MDKINETRINKYLEKIVLPLPTTEKVSKEIIQVAIEVMGVVILSEQEKGFLPVHHEEQGEHIELILDKLLSNRESMTIYNDISNNIDIDCNLKHLEILIKRYNTIIKYLYITEDIKLYHEALQVYADILKRNNRNQLAEEIIKLKNNSGNYDEKLKTKIKSRFS